MQFKGYAVVWHQFAPGKQGKAGIVAFDFKPLPSFSVNLWGSSPHTNDDCHTGKDFQSLAEAIEAFEYPELHFAKLALYGEVHIEIVGPGINNVRVIGTRRPDCDDDWARERAMQNGMAFGVAGYNDTFGYSANIKRIYFHENYNRVCKTRLQAQHPYRIRSSLRQ